MNPQMKSNEPSQLKSQTNGATLNANAKLLRLAVIATLAVAATMLARAQDAVLLNSSSALPDAPSSLVSRDLPLTASTNETTVAPQTHTASKYTKDISPDETAVSLTASDKVVLGARDLYSFGNFGAIFASAGFSHITNGQPNFGTDKGAFGERLGVAGVRETAQGVFTDMVFSPAFHQDPRYYVMGSSHNFLKRTFYAVSRTVVGRSDSGRALPNFALLSGYAAATAVTVPIGPQVNRNFHDGAAAYGGSLGGAALGFFVSEFADDALRAIHIRK